MGALDRKRRSNHP